MDFFRNLRKLGSQADKGRSFVLHGAVLNAPVDHPLARIKQAHPDYAENTGRIARAVYTKHQCLRMIDVGANIGDTVALVRDYVPSAELLCIEPAAQYRFYLETNATAFQPGITIDGSILGNSRGCVNGVLALHDGTGGMRVQQSLEAGPSRVETTTLPELLEARYPQFLGTQFLKIDTDGFDGRIITGATEWLRTRQPVLFWEFDPDLDFACDGPGIGVFQVLADCGYDTLLFWLNTGEFMLSLKLHDRGLLEDLTSLFTGHKSRFYADVCALAGKDADLAAKLRNQEREHTAQLRGFAGRGGGVGLMAPR